MKVAVDASLVVAALTDTGQAIAQAYETAFGKAKPNPDKAGHG